MAIALARSSHLARNRLREIVPKLAVLLILLAVSACVTEDAVPPHLRAVRTIGVISAIGDEFTVTKAGLNGLRNTSQRLSIEPWGIDDLMVSRVGALLSSRYEVQPIIYRRAVFAALGQDSPVAVMNLLRGDEATELVRTEASPQALDAYVVITKAQSTYGSTGRTVRGIGIVSHGALFDSSTQLHALYTVRVIDGHALGVVDKRSAAPLDDGEMTRLEGPSHLVDAPNLPTTDDVAGDEKMKAAVIDLIDRSLKTTLQDMRLVDRS
jgi:hypothetical protein